MKVWKYWKYKFKGLKVKQYDHYYELSCSVELQIVVNKNEIYCDSSCEFEFCVPDCMFEI